MHKRVVAPVSPSTLSPNNDRPFPSPILYTVILYRYRVMSISQLRWINNNTRVPENHLNDVATE